MYILYHNGAAGGAAVSCIWSCVAALAEEVSSAYTVHERDVLQTAYTQLIVAVGVEMKGSVAALTVACI